MFAVVVACTALPAAAAVAAARAVARPSKNPLQTWSRHSHHSTPASGHPYLNPTPSDPTGCWGLLAKNSLSATTGPTCTKHALSDLRLGLPSSQVSPPRQHVPRSASSERICSSTYCISDPHLLVCKGLREVRPPGLARSPHGALQEYSHPRSTSP